jgi:hypothetical protein
MLIEAPTSAGREEFASEINQCTSDQLLQDLANLYKDHFICCCKLSLKEGLRLC